MSNCYIKYFKDGTVQARVTSFELTEQSTKSGAFTKAIRTKNKPENETDDIKEAVEKERRSVAASTRRTRETIFDLARNNAFSFFTTYTFDPCKVNSFDYDAVSKKMSNYLCGLHRRNPDCRYIIVPELHKSGRYHFHGLVGDADMRLSYSGHEHHGQPVYNIGDFTLGYSTCSEIRQSALCASYLCKYVTKDLCSVSKGRKRYWCSHNLERPTVERRTITSIEQLFSVFGTPDYEKESVISKPDFQGTVRLYEFHSIGDKGEA